MTVYTLSSFRTSRLESLKAKHIAISEKIKKAGKSPGTADYYLRQLKKKKLILKDAIQSLMGQSANQSVNEGERA